VSDLKREKSFSKSNSQDSQVFDRQSYFKNIRNDFLTKIGLPPDTKPAQVIKILEIKKQLEIINNKKHN
jgi:hypothetical protein